MKFKISWIVLILAIPFFLSDVYTDIAAGETLMEWGIEALFFTAIVFTLIYEIMQSVKYSKQLQSHEIALDSLKGNLAEVVKTQFDKWTLSASEKEVAWLVIKGFSFNDIAEMRQVNERTIRKQASAIYKKSNTSNRSEFTACFLDDLLNHNYS